MNNMHVARLANACDTCLIPESDKGEVERRLAASTKQEKNKAHVVVEYISQIYHYCNRRRLKLQ